jgi:alkanesulfonate monooxygenase SsuD/methylene tetrahydromethanopterin reductase-like flavin-dependent oxidoreductase (luciferase family)
MTDYGHELLFGTFVTPRAEQPRQVLDLARHTEEAGLDLVSVQDHPYQPAFLDTWTLLSVIAASTSRVSVLPNVANLPLRPPAVLARSAASLDILSGGRVELGLGAGAFWEAVAANGGPHRTPGEAVAALEEAIGVIRTLWTPGRGARLAGVHYQLTGAKPGPFPAHDIGIWLGGYKPRMLRLTGRLADGWLPSSPYLPPEQLPSANRIIDDAATAAGRSPGAVRRLYNITGSFGGTGTGFLAGPPHVWAEQLTELALAHGISGFILMVDSADLVRRYADEVVPAVRELVAAGRSGAPPVPRRPPDRDPDPHRLPPGAGEELIRVHNHLRAELATVQDLVRQVADGRMTPGQARSHINEMTLRQNNWTMGAYCESYCRLVTLHHTLEDRTVFPHLRRAEPGLAPVLDRLATEHQAIHGLLDGVDRALVAVVTGSGPEEVAGLTAAVDRLGEQLLTHLSYEESQLVEPLSKYGYF